MTASYENPKVGHLYKIKTRFFIYEGFNGQSCQNDIVMIVKAKKVRLMRTKHWRVAVLTPLGEVRVGEMSPENFSRHFKRITPP
jgi:hypothetical protein